MLELEKELLEIFDDGLDSLNENRYINYNSYKKIKRLLQENKIEIKIIK